MTSICVTDTARMILVRTPSAFDCDIDIVEWAIDWHFAYSGLPAEFGTLYSTREAGCSEVQYLYGLYGRYGVYGSNALVRLCYCHGIISQGSRRRIPLHLCMFLPDGFRAIFRFARHVFLRFWMMKRLVGPVADSLRVTGTLILHT